MLVQTEDCTAKHIEDRLSQFINSVYLKINSIGIWTSRVSTQASYTSNDIELVFYTKGGSRTTIQNKEYTCTEGNLMLLTPFGLVTSINEGYDYYEYIYVHFEVVPASCQHRFLDLLINQAQVFQANEIIAQYLKMMLQEQREQKVGYQGVINALLKQVCIEIIRLQGVEHHSLEGSFIHRQDPRQLVSSVISLMNERVYESVTIAQIANEVGISESYLFKMFKKVMGISPSNCLIKRKMMEAKKLLASQLYTVGEISDLLCYSSVYHFSAIFKKYEGCTPKQYQQAMKQKEQ